MTKSIIEFIMPFINHAEEKISGKKIAVSGKRQEH